MLKRLVLIIGCIIFAVNVSSQNDTIAVYYDIGVYKLHKKNKKIIRAKLAKLNDSIKYHVEIISSCDFLGTNEKNLELSMRRAETVRNLLTNKENIIISSITHKGIGEIPVVENEKSTKGILTHRKTLLIFKSQSEHIFDQIAASKAGETFIINNIVFDAGRHLFKKESIEIIKKLLTVLEKNPKLKIEISGHVCCGVNPKDSIDAFDKDTKTYNLSKNRAKHIYRYLVLKKIDSSRLTYKGYGFLKPLKFPELTPKDKLNNRRVEIKVLSN